jgi:anti-sigma B factor antagonist
MRIDIDHDDQVTIVRPEDRLDIVGYLELEECLGDRLREGRTRLVLDLEEATFINSSALAVMSRFWADCARAGGTLVIARPSREARNFLRLGDLDDLIDIYPTLEEAVQAARTRKVSPDTDLDPQR